MSVGKGYTDRVVAKGRSQLLKERQEKHGVHVECVSVDGIDEIRVNSKSPFFTNPVLPIPGQDIINESWQTSLINAPIAYQLQQVNKMRDSCMKAEIEHQNLKKKTEESMKKTDLNKPLVWTYKKVYPEKKKERGSKANEAIECMKKEDEEEKSQGRDNTSKPNGRIENNTNKAHNDVTIGERNSQHSWVACKIDGFQIREEDFPSLT